MLKLRIAPHGQGYWLMRPLHMGRGRDRRRQLVTAQLKVSLSQQIEEVDLNLKELNEMPQRQKQGDWRLRVQRTEAIRRSLRFIEDHKAEFMALVEQKGKPEMVRNERQI